MEVLLRSSSSSDAGWAPQRTSFVIVAVNFSFAASTAGEPLNCSPSSSALLALALLRGNAGIERQQQQKDILHVLQGHLGGQQLDGGAHVGDDDGDSEHRLYDEVEETQASHVAAEGVFVDSLNLLGIQDAVLAGWERHVLRCIGGHAQGSGFGNCTSEGSCMHRGNSRELYVGMHVTGDKEQRT